MMRWFLLIAIDKDYIKELKLILIDVIVMLDDILEVDVDVSEKE